MFKSPSLKAAAAFALLASTGLPAQAQDSGALVDALVKKGVLTDQEAKDVRSQMKRDLAQTPAGKINLNSSVTELKLYGDLRLRYQYENKDNQVDPAEVGSNNPQQDRSPSGQQRSRWRFRLRLNADFRLANQFSGGVELQTNQNSDSANQTFEDGFDDYNIFISKAYFKWEPNEWLGITAGKFSNPFYTTESVWDPDINPSGLAESVAFHKLFASKGAATEADAKGGFAKDARDAKDGKSMAPAASGGKNPWEFTLVAGQFIFDDNLEGGGRDNATRDNDATTDAYLFETQLIASYDFGGGIKATLAPAYFTYVNGSLGGLRNENSFNDTALVSGATRNLNLLLAPGDVSFKIGSLKTKFYWDFSYNIEGRKRAEDIYDLFTFANDAGQSSDDDVTDPDDKRSKHVNEDDYAYLVGLQFGENKKRGDYSFLANWRQTGIAAVDPNLNDSDFAASELNTRGAKFSLAYNFTDFAVGAVTYMYAWNLRDNLFGGQATNDNAVADSNVVQVLQVDFNVKF